MSSEYTREFVIKFLPAQFSWIYVEFEECLNRNFIHWNIFHLIVYLKVAVKNSPIIWMQFDTGYKLQRRQTGSLSNNQFMIGILTWFDASSSFRNLRIILSDLRFDDTFQFVKYGASGYFFFSLLSAQNEVNEVLPVNSLLFVAVK